MVKIIDMNVEGEKKKERKECGRCSFIEPRDLRQRLRY